MKRDVWLLTLCITAEIGVQRTDNNGGLSLLQKQQQ